MLFDVNKSLLLAKHLRDRSNMDDQWVNTLDELFMSSVYEQPVGQPIFWGPDSLPYFRFDVAKAAGSEQLDFHKAMDHVIHWGMGVVLNAGPDVQEYVYSPGDIISLASTGTSRFQWDGDWGKDPIVSDYVAGAPLSVAKPNDEFLLPLAARHLECVMRRIFSVEYKLKGRAPGVAVLRPDSRTQPDQASELSLNVCKADFGLVTEWEAFQVLIRHYLPTFLGKRLISFDVQVLPWDRYFPLSDMLKESGLQPIPDIKPE